MFGEPLFGSLVIFYLFLGGAAAGAIFVISAWSIAFHRSNKQHSERFQQAFRSMMSYSYVVGLILLVFSMLCLLWDLGAPHRMLNLYTRPSFTVLTFGSYALLFEFLIVAFLVAVNVINLPHVSGRVRKVVEYLSCAVSVAVMVYTGVFLATNASVPFWNNWVLVLLFLLSSLSAGVSIVLLIDYFVKDQTLLLRAARPLQKAHVTLLAVELLCMAGFFALALINPEAERSAVLLLRPEMLSVIVLGVFGMGVLVPLVLESYNLKTKPYRSIPVSDVICLIGGLCLRYVIIMCGVH